MATCLVCHEYLSDKKVKLRAKYCSKKCADKAARERYEIKRPSFVKGQKVRSASTTGAMHELLACADLMDKEYHVFRALSPHCPCDVMAMKNGIVYKIEITTGQHHSRNTYSYPPKKESGYDFDILAVVFYTKEVIYLLNNEKAYTSDIIFKETVENHEKNLTHRS